MRIGRLDNLSGDLSARATSESNQQQLVQSVPPWYAQRQNMSRPIYNYPTLNESVPLYCQFRLAS